MTKRNAVINIKSELKMFSERLFVMSAQVSAAAISALLTGVAVPLKDGIAPVGILYFSPIIAITLRLTMLIVVMVFAFRGSLARDFTHSPASFISVFFANTIRVAFSGLTHLAFGLWCVRFSLKGGCSPAERGVRIICSSAVFARGGKTITPRAICIEHGFTFPMSARVAPFFIGIGMGLILFYAYADAFCGLLHSARFAAHILSLSFHVFYVH